MTSSMVQPPGAAPGPPTPRPAIPPDSVVPVVASVVLIGTTIALFGTDATGGPLRSRSRRVRSSPD